MTETRKFGCERGLKIVTKILSHIPHILTSAATSSVLTSSSEDRAAARKGDAVGHRDALKREKGTKSINACSESW